MPTWTNNTREIRIETYNTFIMGEVRVRVFVGKDSMYLTKVEAEQLITGLTTILAQEK